MGNSIAATGKGIKLIITFIIAIALYICITPTEASASYSWGGTKDWNTAVTNSSTTPINATTDITLAANSTGTIYVDSGTIVNVITPTVTLATSTQQLKIMLEPGATLNWSTDVGAVNATTDVVVIDDNGGGAGTTVNFTGSVAGSSSGTMLKFDGDFADINITGNTITNNGEFTNSKALYLGGGADLSGVIISSSSSYGIHLYSGDLDIKGSGNQISGGGGGIYSRSTGALSIENASVSYTGLTSSPYAIEHEGNLTLDTVVISASAGKGINHTPISGTISITDSSITSAETPLYTTGDGTVTNVVISKSSGSSSYAIEATGNLTLDGASTSVSATYHDGIGYNGATGKTLQIKNGTYSVPNNVINHSGGNISISGGTFNSNSNNPSDMAIVKSWGGSLGDTLTISGGELNGGYNKGILIAANSYLNTTITGGTVTGATVTGSTGIYVDSNSYATTIEIYDGEITGSRYGIYMADGTSCVVTITGGTIDASGDTTAEGIYNYTGTVYIAPDEGKTVTVKGRTSALDATIDCGNTPFAAISYDYDTAPYYGIFPTFSFSPEFQYIIFYNETPSFTLTVIGGTIPEKSNPAQIQYGEGFYIEFTEIPGRTFIRWEVSGLEELMALIAQGEFEEDPLVYPQFEWSMPLNAVTFTAIYEEQAASPPAGPDYSSTPNIMAMPVSEIDNGKDDDYSPDYLEKHTYKNYETYVNYDFSVTPAIKDGVIDEKTAYNAIRAAVRRAKPHGVTEIKLNIPEGTEISNRLLTIIAKMENIYGIEVVINYIETEE
jgi:hypothetical protein